MDGIWIDSKGGFDMKNPFFILNLLNSCQTLKFWHCRYDDEVNGNIEKDLEIFARKFSNLRAVSSFEMAINLSFAQKFIDDFYLNVVENFTLDFRGKDMSSTQYETNAYSIEIEDFEKILFKPNIRSAKVKQFYTPKSEILYEVLKKINTDLVLFDKNFDLDDFKCLKSVLKEIPSQNPDRKAILIQGKLCENETFDEVCQNVCNSINSLLNVEELSFNDNSQIYDQLKKDFDLKYFEYFEKIYLSPETIVDFHGENKRKLYRLKNSAGKFVVLYIMFICNRVSWKFMAFIKEI
ncbi:unnamed protein product, partial [Mesorhabditis belari]|uniref:Uncharacterized protein n=1 Tax=Mesorhabditis belari TaxID=2138241 RepID=A0AAF3FM92_9BILA